MFTAEDIAAVKIATDLCNGTELKRDILRFSAAGESEESDVEQDSKDLSMHKKSYNYCLPNTWEVNLDEKASLVLKNLGLGNYLIEKVTGFVILIGMRMCSWALFHKGVFGLTFDFSYNFLKSSLFTSRGIINIKKAAKELTTCQGLKVKQRYKLVCYYCSIDQIPVLFKQLTKDEKKEVCNVSSQSPVMTDLSEIVTFWSSNLDDGREFCKIAMKSGSKASIEYCLGRTRNELKELTMLHMALEAVKSRISVGFLTPDSFSYFLQVDFSGSKRSDDYVDILCFLYDQMNDPLRKKFLTKDFEKESSLVAFRVCQKGYFGALYYFLFWPYQDYFMKAVSLTWEFLPEWIFVDLLVKICCKIQSEFGALTYGEDRTFNYRNLLKEFWCDAPLRYKRCLFTFMERIPERCKKNLKCCEDVFRNLFLLQNFTNEDRRNVELILASATDEEKRSIILSKKGEKTCIKLLRDEKWRRFNLFVSYLFPPTEQSNEFKREFIFTEPVQDICISFARNKKWETAESFIRWTTFSEMDIILFKRVMIHSDYGKSSYIDLILDRFNRKYSSPLAKANMFCDWFFSSEDESREFKKKLTLSEFGDEVCSKLVKQNRVHVIDDLLACCHFTHKNITKFKESFVSKHGCELCKELIGAWHSETRFGKWKYVEKFLTWGFSSVEEILKFKKEKVFDKFGIDILFNLIENGQMEVAETFFLWLDLSFDEIKNFKKETLSSHMSEIHKSVSDICHSRFLKCKGDKWENVERFLRWFLVDKASVHAFIEKFEEEREAQILQPVDFYIGEIWDEEMAPAEIELNNFYKLIAQLLSCLS